MQRAGFAAKNRDGQWMSVGVRGTSVQLEHNDLLERLQDATCVTQCCTLRVGAFKLLPCHHDVTNERSHTNTLNVRGPSRKAAKPSAQTDANGTPRVVDTQQYLT